MARWAIEPRGEYPPDWISGAIQKQLAEHVGYTCEHCGVAIDPETGNTIGKPRRDGKEHFIAIHHIDGNKANCDYTNLLYCCQACHLEVQGAWGPGAYLPQRWLVRFNGPPAWMVRRGLPYMASAQLSLFDNQDYV